MDEKDSMMSDAIPRSTPVDGTVPAGRKNRRPVVIGVAAVAAVALVAGGVCGYGAYENHRVSMAREACQSAVTNLGKTVKSYKALLGADATTAALKAVESSKLDKTVADADGLYRATEGNVQDERTREALKQAIAKRDAGAIAKAVKAVNDSMAAKTKADAETKAKAEQEAAEAAAAAQAQQSYSAPRQSYTPSYSGGSTSGGGASSVPDFVPVSKGFGCTTDCPPPSSDGLIHH